VIPLIWLLTISLAGWFGFELGRKWDAGREEIVAEAEERRESERGGVRLNRIVMRR
jgi:hypothetical protein